MKEVVIGGGVTVVLSLLGFLSKSAYNGVTGILKDIREELKKLSGKLIEHEQRIRTLEESRKDHEQRIRTLENEK